ncbi:MAG: S1C family serine protease [Phycisphaerales bacterium]|jgi:serine protease Do
MRRLEHLGPALVTLAAAGVLLLLAPSAIRQYQRETMIRRAADAERRLEQGTVLDQLSQATRDIADVVEPSVVHVSVTGSIRGALGSRAYRNTGSGWVYDTQGHIVTNAHVIDGAQRIEVQLAGGDRADARLVGQDLRTDIAVLEVSVPGLQPARRSTEDPRQGDMVFAFGSPFDFRFSMSSGIVSGLERTADLQDIDYENFIQTDAAINPGNSGGPLTDTRGVVVGMSTAIATGSGRGSALGQGQFAGIGLAIPISMIENVVDQIITRGEVEKGFLGVRGVDVADLRNGRVRAPTLLAAVESWTGDGAIVDFVSPGSPAEAAGVQVGDVIVSIGGQRVASAARMRTLIANHRPGDRVKVQVWRLQPGSTHEGEVVDLEAQMARLDPETNMEEYAAALRAVGFTRLLTLTEAEARARGIEFRRGVLVDAVDPESSIAAEAPANAVIVEAFGGSVATVDDLYLRISRGLPESARRLEIPLTIVRPTGERAQLVIPLPRRVR